MKLEDTTVHGFGFSFREPVHFWLARRTSYPRPLTAGRRSYACLKMILFFVMAGLVPAIHVFLAWLPLRRGGPAQGRASRVSRKSPIPLAGFWVRLQRLRGCLR